MATATFDKKIVLTAEAAEKLAEMLREPAPPTKDMSEVLERSRGAWSRYLDSKKYSQETTAN